MTDNYSCEPDCDCYICQDKNEPDAIQNIPLDNKKKKFLNFFKKK